MKSSAGGDTPGRHGPSIGRMIKTKEDDGSFDIEFWDRYTPSERMMLVWTMVVEEHVARGGKAEDLAMERSVASMQRRHRED